MKKQPMFIRSCIVLSIIAALLTPGKVYAQAAVTLNLTSGPAGTTVTASGSGFSPYQVVDISWDGNWINETKGDAIGAFQASFQLPTDAAAGDHIINFNGSESVDVHFTITVPPAPKPGGMWISPQNNFTAVPGQTLRLAARAYPSANNGSRIAKVNFTALFNLDPDNQSGLQWHVLKTFTQPTSGTDTYEYDWDLTWDNLTLLQQPIAVSFDVYDQAGNANLAPNGVHYGTAPEPVTACPSGGWNLNLFKNSQNIPVWGTMLGSVDGVNFCSNGSKIENSHGMTTYGEEFQCLQFVQWYYAKQGWSSDAVWPGATGKDPFAYKVYKTPPSGTTSIANDGTSLPVRGDALVFDKSDGDLAGHVALVTDVVGGKIFLAEQNYFGGGQGFVTIDPKTHIIIPRSSQGAVLGWVHAYKNKGGLATQPEVLGVEVALPGISIHENNAPKHPTRYIYADIYDSQQNLVYSGGAKVQYDNQRGVFVGQFTGFNLPTGLYSVKVWMSNTLRKWIPARNDPTQTLPLNTLNVISKGDQTNLFVGMQVQGISTKAGDLVFGLPLVSGDINYDNQLNVLDYNILVSCMQKKSCPPGSIKYQNADLNDDGVVDQFDVTIWQKDVLNSSQGD